MQTLKLSLAALGVLVLVGAGCAPSASPAPATPTDTPEVVTEEKSMDPIPYSQVTGGLLENDDIYLGFRFTETSGNCSELGAPSAFDYAEDPALGYKVTLSADGTYRDNWTMGTPSTVTFDELTVNEQPATCKAKVTYQKDVAEVTCANEEVELCKGSYDVVALPR